MLEYDDIKKIKRLYKQKKNIMNYFRSKSHLIKGNSLDAILYSYDLQAGNYIKDMLDPKKRKRWQEIGKRLNDIFSNYAPKTVLEVGIGEGNIMVHIISSKKFQRTKFYGFDMSLSRLLFAQKYFSKVNYPFLKLFAAEMTNIPIPHNSFDIVYTVHAIEPNHGREKVILEELLRIANHYLIMIEPSFELGSEKARKWIKKNNYCRNLPRLVKEMGHKIIKHELLPLSHGNNEVALIIVEKKTQNPKSSSRIQYVSPVSGKPLVQRDDCLFCSEDGYAFPIINGIPCLLKNNGILVSKLNKFDKFQ